MNVVFIYFFRILFVKIIVILHSVRLSHYLQLNICFFIFFVYSLHLKCFKMILVILVSFLSFMIKVLSKATKTFHARVLFKHILSQVLFFLLLCQIDLISLSIWCGITFTFFYDYMNFVVLFFRNTSG